MSKIIQHKNKFLTIKNYKEPLREILKEDGYGYYGTLLCTTDGNLVQCHVCGELFKDVASHSRQAHKIATKDYKLRFGLSNTTALISESERLRRQEIFLKNIEKMDIEEIRRRGREAQLLRKAPQPKESLEKKNIKGTCPDQLLAKIAQIKEKLNKVPTLSEFIIETGGQRYKHLIFKTFGSWAEALEMLGYEPNEKKNGKSIKHRYKDEELIEYLIRFVKQNKRIPTFTDFKRGLLPDYQVYARRFGSLENARQEAGINKLN